MGIEPLPPALLLLAGALPVPLLRGRVQAAYLLLLPLLGLANQLAFPEGEHWVVPFLDYQLVLVRVDEVSRLFGVIFHLVTFLGLLYCLNFRRNGEFLSALAYAAAALGAVFAGDLFTFYGWWELLAVAATFLILERRTRRSLRAGLRYLLVHIGGGLVLLAGIAVYVAATGTLEFGPIGLGAPGGWLIYLGFGINCAWPLLHGWLTDTYPEATIGGVVFLSAFTTKTAVYALLRGFAGEPSLIGIGAAMTAFPIFYAVIENDLRRVLSYSLINQVGFMVVGVGIGTELSLNGAVAHVFTDVLFKALLFMSVGAALLRTGTANATGLGGLYRSMPFTCACCIVGAASISAFPLFSAFISKSMVVSAAAEGHLVVVWFVLLFASAGVFHHAGIKIPFFTFFSHDAGHRVDEAPPNMRVAMGITAFLCLLLGSFPGLLYRWLPYPVDYAPYTLDHVMAQTLLLVFSALAFTLLMLSGIYPAEMRAVNLDADWFYRRGGRWIQRFCQRGLAAWNDALDGALAARGAALVEGVRRLPVEASLAVLAAGWVLAGLDRGEVERRREQASRALSAGAVPIGLTAVWALALVALLYFL